MKKMFLVFGLSLLSGLPVMAQQQDAIVLDRAVIENAQRGDPYAQYAVGLQLLERGDETNAASWLRASVMGGYTDACRPILYLMQKNEWRSEEVEKACMIKEGQDSQ